MLWLQCVGVQRVQPVAPLGEVDGTDPGQGGARPRERLEAHTVDGVAERVLPVVEPTEQLGDLEVLARGQARR